MLLIAAGIVLALAAVSLMPRPSGSANSSAPDGYDPVAFALAQTAWGEARSDGHAGMQAVLSVIANRLHDPAGRFGLSWYDVIFAPGQFDVWMTGAGLSANHNATVNVDPNDPLFQDAYRMAQEAIAGDLPDNTGGATYYRNPAVPASARVLSFFASLIPTVRIGAQQFFRG